MTSSLVGSEMCIRDSLCTWAEPPFGGMRLGPPRVKWSFLAYWRALWPVSYTHLTLPTICSV
eukprot:2572408-Prorocentrum_lima.AAC.1